MARLQVDEVVSELAGEEAVSEDEVVTLCGLRHSGSSAFLGSDTLKEGKISQSSCKCSSSLVFDFILNLPEGWG